MLISERILSGTDISILLLKGFGKISAEELKLLDSSISMKSEQVRQNELIIPELELVSVRTNSQLCPFWFAVAVKFKFVFVHV